MTLQDLGNLGHIIPETLERTTIGDLRPGNEVNTEIDSMTQMIVETVRRTMEPES